MICRTCGKEFTSQGTGRPKTYCSPECKKQADLIYWRERPYKQKKPTKLKGLNDLENTLKQQGDFYDEYRKWKIAKAMEKVDPIILEVSHDK